MRPLSKHLTWSLAGTILAKIPYLMAMLIAARWFPREQLGYFAIFTSVMAFIQPFLTLRLEIPIILAPTKLNAKLLAVMTGAISTISIATLTVIYIIILNLMPDRRFENMLSLPISAVVFCATVTAALTILTALFQRNKRFEMLCFSQLLNATIFLLLMCLGRLFLGNKAEILIWSYSVAICGSMSILAISSLREKTQSCLVWNLRRFYILLRRYRAYPLYILPLTLCYAAYERILLLYLAAAFSMEALGGYFFLRQIAYSAQAIVCGSIRQVLFSYIAATPADVQKWQNTILILSSSVALSSGMITGWISVNSELLATTLFGRDWEQSGHVLPWIVAMAAFGGIVHWQDRLLDVLAKQKLAAYIQMLINAGNVSCIFISWSCHSSFNSAVEILALGSILMDISLLGVVFFLSGFKIRWILVVAACFAGSTLLTAWAAGIFGHFTAGIPMLVISGSVVSLLSASLFVAGIFAVQPTSVTWGHMKIKRLYKSGGGRLRSNAWSRSR